MPAGRRSRRNCRPTPYATPNRLRGRQGDGWPQDSVDACLVLLTLTEHLQAAQNEKPVLTTLQKRPLSSWRDQCDALPMRFENARIEAARRLEPKATSMKLPPASARHQAPSPTGRGVGGEGAHALGYRPLPELHIACTGIAPQAPTLGSLIAPNELPANLVAADYETIQPYIDVALTAEHVGVEAHERAVAAHGMIKAADSARPTLIRSTRAALLRLGAAVLLHGRDANGEHMEFAAEPSHARQGSVNVRR